jgi:hypothetical protein
LAILASLLLPALSSAKGQSGMTKCKSNLRQIGLGLLLYVTDDGKYPRQFIDPGTAQHGSWWFQSIEPDVGVAWTNTLYHCPANRFTEVFTDIMSQGGVEAQGSYGFNPDGTEADGRDTANLGLGKIWSFRMPSRPSISESDVLVPGDMIAVADGGFVGVGVVHPSTNSAAVALPLPADWRFSWHQAGENVFFCDGHLEQIKRMQVFDVKLAAPRWNNDHQPHPETW